MRSHTINKETHFIGGWYINKKVCTDLINYFKKNKSHWGPGMLGMGEGKKGVNKKQKLSTDVTILNSNGDKEVINYVKALGKVLNKYKKEYPWCGTIGPWALYRVVKIQKYLPGEAYFKTHYENEGNSESIKRHLTFMTYLNTVKEGGETEWPSQELKLKPIKGLTAIWPAHFTHPHRGIPAPGETKYIITGWYYYE